MSTAPAVAVSASKYYDPEKNKFIMRDQVFDESGNPVGPPQVFEADTLDELLEKRAAAHLSAAKKLYETRQAVKLGDILDGDPDQPLPRFEERPLSADERVKIAAALKDPASAPEAIKVLFEAYLGAPVSKVREALQQIEIDKRVSQGQAEVEAFKAAHPEYVECDRNHDLIVKWLNKRKLALTKKNLELAYGDLTSVGLLTVQAPKPETLATPAASAATAAAAPAPPPTPEIPATATPAAQIGAQPAEVRPRVSSTGLSSRGSSATPAAPAAKAQGITLQDVRKMNASQYGEAMARGLFDKDGKHVMTAKEFRDRVEELLK